MKELVLKSKIKEKINSKNLDIIILLIYAIITFIITIIFHEKWRDEAQAWLIARDLDFVGILKQMGYEGHPPLWHFILMPFAKLGFPYMTMSVISWAISCITSWLIIKKAPFKRKTKILILLSAPFIYFYPTIARSYCLIPLATTLIAINYPKRNEKKISYVLSVLFLAYTHVLMLGLVGILYLLFFLEQLFFTKKSKNDIKKLVVALAIAIIGLLCLALILMGSIKSNNDVSVAGTLQIRAHSPQMFIRLIKLHIKNITYLLWKLEGGIVGVIGNTSGFQTICFIAIIMLLILEFKTNIVNAVVLCVSCLWQFFIYLFIYADTAEQKVNTLFIIFIFIAWLNTTDKENKKNLNNEYIKKIIIQFCMFVLILSDIYGLSAIQNEIKYLYSDAKNVANFIEEELEEDAILVGINAPTPTSIVPFTKNKKIWNACSNSYYTYMVWDENANVDLPINQIINNIKENFSSKDNVYLIESYENRGVLKEENEEIIELQEKGILSHVLYMSEIQNLIHTEEAYKIYRVNL